MKSGQNVFVSFLELLHVKHTQEFSNRYFNEHPHKYNLFGLSKMLYDYGVENAGIRVFFSMIIKNLTCEMQMIRVLVAVYLFHSNSIKYFRLKRLLFFTRAVSLSRFVSLPHSFGVG